MPRNNDESLLQQRCCNIATTSGLLFIKIKNESVKPSVTYLAKMKREGLVAGIPDAIIINRRDAEPKSVFVEFKRPSKKKAESLLSENQVSTISNLRDRGQKVYVVNDEKDFLLIVCKEFNVNIIL